MFELITALVRYLFACLLVSSTIFIAVFSDTAAMFVFRTLFKDAPVKPEYPLNFLKDIFMEKTTISPSAVITISLYGPACAFAALLPVCAVIPFFSFIPIMDNGADLLQIAQLLLLSDVIAIISVGALGVSGSITTVKVMFKESISQILPLVVFFVSVSAYVNVDGLSADVFSLASLQSLSDTYTKVPILFYVGICIFCFVILSQLPHKDYKTPIYFLKPGELAEYKGMPRFLMTSRSLFRSFILTAIVVDIFFPLMRFILPTPNLPVSWLAQLSVYIEFWTIVILARSILVTLSWLLFDKINALLPRNLRPALVPVLTFLAAALVFFRTALWQI